jgi:hypothetical protein
MRSSRDMDEIFTSTEASRDIDEIQPSAVYFRPGQFQI